MMTSGPPDERLPMRVLVVDDEPVVRRFMTRLLGRLVEHVEEAGDGQQALERVTNTDDPVNLVITDLSMPRLNGIDLARCLHQLEAPPPVVLMTAYDSPDVQQLLDGGIITELLRKPTPLQQLVQILERHAGEPR